MYVVLTYVVTQIPYEVCEVVPDIECVNVLKKVPELQCTPEIFEDCNDVEKRVPYLVPEEDCVEVTFDECQEVISLDGLFYMQMKCSKDTS